MTLNDWFLIWLIFTIIVTILYIAEHIRFWYFEYPKFNVSQSKESGKK